MTPLTHPFRRFPETELALAVPLIVVPEAVPETLHPPVLPHIEPPDVTPPIVWAFAPENGM